SSEGTGLPRRHAVRLYGSVGEDGLRAARRGYRHVQTLGREPEGRRGLRRRAARADQATQPLRALKRQTMAGALEGLRVVDLTMMLAGPFCTMLLADQGADVIKVEPVAGDGTRRMGPYPKDVDRRTTYGAYFQSINRGKRSIGIDLKTPNGKQLLRKLV